MAEMAGMVMPTAKGEAEALKGSGSGQSESHSKYRRRSVRLSVADHLLGSMCVRRMSLSRSALLPQGGELDSQRLLLCLRICEGILRGATGPGLPQ